MTGTGGRRAEALLSRQSVALANQEALVGALLLGVAVALSGCADRAETPARRGVATLAESWSGERAVLDGEWAFYRDRFLTPEEVIAADGIPEPSHWVEIPSYWNGLRRGATGSPGDAEARAWQRGFGHGTYLLELRGAELDEPLGVFLRFACTAYRLYSFDAGAAALASTPMIESGVVAVERERGVPGNLPLSGASKARTGRQFLLVQVSNWDHSGGGLCAPPVVAGFERIERLRVRKRVLDAAIIGMLLTLAIYNFGIWTQRREERVSLWLGVIAADAMVRTVATSAFFEFVWGRSSRLLFEASYKTEYVTLAIAGIAIAQYMYYSFPEQVGRTIVHYTRWPGTVLCAIVLITPLWFYSLLVEVFELWLVAGVLFLGARLTRAVWRRVPYAGLTAIGTIPVFITAYYDIAVAQLWTGTIYLMPYALVIFVFAQAMIVARRFSAALGTAQSLSRDLQTAVDERTAQLRERTEELEAAQETLRTFSVTDALTGLYNRHYFEQNFRREWRRAARSGDPLALVMADIDHFKRINDQRGHPAGDRCLQAVAAALLSLARRAGDFVVRLGGEEFLVVLPGSDAAGGLRFAEEVRRAIAELDFVEAGLPVPVTVSIGVAAAVPGGSVEPSDLLASADVGLYEAKAAGRDRIVVATLGGAVPAQAKRP